MVFPDYARSILSVAASVYAHYGIVTGYPPLAELEKPLAERPGHVFLILLDGLGSDGLSHLLPENAYLRRHAAATVTSVFPPTTTAATTSYYSGKSPLEHGWLGWQMYFKEYASEVVTFRNRAYYADRTVGSEPPAYRLLAYETIFEQIRAARPGVKLHSICPFPAYHERGADMLHRATAFAQACAQMRRIAERPEESFTLVYWPQPDADMHEFGAESPQARAQYARLNRELEMLSHKLRDALLIITSDHGLTDVSEQIPVHELPELMEMLVLPPSLEPRAAAFYVKPHRGQAFEEYFRARFSRDFRLLARSEVYASGLFGRGEPHRKFDDFIGDYLAVATGARCFGFAAADGTAPVQLRGRHAGLTAAEMRVLVAYHSIGTTGEER